MKTATIVPIHPKHLQEGINCLYSFKENSKNDFFFVFSSTEDRDFFQSRMNRVLDHIMIDRETVERYPQGVITVKKLFGLRSIFDRYDYIGVFDSETVFVREFDSDVIYPDIYSKHYLKANRSLKGGEVVKNCALVMNLHDNQTLIQETDNYTQYWWFNEIAVYERDSFSEFFDFILSSSNKEQILSGYWHFDYLLYGIWLICFKNFKVKKCMQNREFHWGAVEDNGWGAPPDDLITTEFNSYIDRTNYLKHQKVKALIQQ